MVDRVAWDAHKDLQDGQVVVDPAYVAVHVVDLDDPAVPVVLKVHLELVLVLPVLAVVHANMDYVVRAMVPDFVMAAP